MPDSYLLKPATDSAASENDADDNASLAWTAIWRARYGEIAILGVALTTLTAILFLQAPISRRPRLHRWIRIGFLSWTLVWLGWYAGAQLTVVLVITWIHSLVTDFRWDYLLADPLIAILLGFTIVSLFLWGRAAFCGWLCPFGALQELTNKAARRLRIPQLTIPVALHGRLVVAKYVLFVALVGVSFVSWDLAMAGTEIEPFKAAIVLRFMTQWPMVVYALALIAASMFVERFYCRFACPLGGGLAIFGKVRIFDSLKRHPECGSRCRVCESVCPVGAIKRNGQINMNECFYCLDCQVTYYDDHTLPADGVAPQAPGTAAGPPALAGRNPRRGDKPMKPGSLARRRAITILGAFAGMPLLAGRPPGVRSRGLVSMERHVVGIALATAALSSEPGESRACGGALHGRDRAAGADLRVVSRGQRGRAPEPGWPDCNAFA